jgi:hypothetical protein
MSMYMHNAKTKMCTQAASLQKQCTFGTLITKPTKLHTDPIIAMLGYAEIVVAFFCLFLLLWHWRWNKHSPIINWPLFGMLPGLLQNASQVPEFATRLLKHYGGTLEFKGPWFTNMHGLCDHC